MKKEYVKIFGGAVLGLGFALPAQAFVWPSFDITEIANTIMTGISQIEAQVSTVQETYSTSNILQAIGDNLGGLSKIKDQAKELEKQKEKAERIAARVEKLKKLKADYENAKKKFDSAMEEYQKTKTQIDFTKKKVEGYVNTASQAATSVANQAEALEERINAYTDGTQSATRNYGSTQSVNTTAEQVSNQGALSRGFSAAQDEAQTTEGLQKTDDVQTVKIKKESAEDGEGVSSQTYLIDEGMLDEKNIDDLWQAVDDSDKENASVDEMGEDTLKGDEEEPEEQSVRKAFEKVSFKWYETQSFAFEINTKTGTDDEGNYIFSDTLANWCGFNFDDEIDQDKATACIDTIVSNMNESDAVVAKQFKDRFGEVQKEESANSFVQAKKARSAAADSEVSENMQNILDKAGDNARTQMSGNGEVGAANIELLKQNLLVNAALLEKEVLRSIEEFASTYGLKDQAKE
ncbi:MAG: hypothetical protein IJS26_02980 [Alphaproteobacteria bacterium]|nr:hypothetical protein [Alphaproteobacteria bacterium]